MRRSIVLLVAMGCGHAGTVTEASTLVYARQDTDATTIVSPSLHLKGEVGPTTVAAEYAIDAWTGASVDVVTAATSAIHERRHEVNLTVGYEKGAVAVSANYRRSIENDYDSNGLTLGTRLSLANKNTILGADLLASFDTVGRSGDPNMSEPSGSIGGRFTLMQILDTRTLVELGFQTLVVDGYQASPYRYVAIGDLGTCGSLAPFCLPEHVPDHRVRDALTLRFRRALGTRASTGLDYRFYFDDWGLQSHALEPDLALRVTDASTLTLRYRYTTQSEAFFYRPRYFTLDEVDGFVTRDRKLSALVANELGLQFMQRRESDSSTRVWSWGLRSTLSRVDYLAFVGLDHVWAAELTVLLGVAR